MTASLNVDSGLIRRYSVLMDKMKQRGGRIAICLTDYTGGPDGWGTELGARVFSALNLLLLRVSEGVLIEIDYSGLRRSDVSFQREAVVETLRKFRPRLLFAAVNLGSIDVQENLEMALERRGESLILRKGDTQIVVGKKLSQELEMVWRVVVDSGEMTSALLRQRMPGTELSTASSRLTALWKAGLVQRVEGTSISGGREHRYYRII